MSARVLYLVDRPETSRVHDDSTAATPPATSAREMVTGVGFVRGVGFAIAQFTLQPFRTIDVSVCAPAVSLDAVCPGSEVTRWTDRVDDCLRRFPLVAVHRFDHALTTLASEEIPEVGDQIREWNARRDAQPSPGWLLDIASECVETGVAFPRICRRLGLISEHLTSRTTRAALTRAVAIGLIAAHEINLCSWSAGVDLDEIVSRAGSCTPRRQDASAVAGAPAAR